MYHSNPLTAPNKQGEWSITAQGIVSPSGVVYPHISGGEGTQTPPEPKLVPEADLIAVKQGLQAQVDEWKGKATEYESKMASVEQASALVAQQLVEERAAKAAVEEKYKSVQGHEETIKKLTAELTSSQQTISLLNVKAQESMANLLISQYRVPEAMVRTSDGKAYKPLSELQLIQGIVAQLRPQTLTLDGGGAGGPTPDTSVRGVNKISAALDELHRR